MAPRQTAAGVARYGYGGSGGYGGYYPGCGWYGGWYGGYYGWWGAGYWGWPYYGWGYPYAYDYAPYGPTYVMGDEPHIPADTPAILETDVTPSKAEVLLDGVSMGRAKDFNGHWDEMRVAPGRHSITFQREGHRTLTVTFDAGPGRHYVFDQVLAKGSGEERLDRTEAPAAAASQDGAHASAKAFVKMRVLPADAGVYLDGEYLGTGGELAALHGAIPVAPGEHRVEVVRPGFRSDARTVVVATDAPALVELTLEREGP